MNIRIKFRDNYYIVEHEITENIPEHGIGSNGWMPIRVLEKRRDYEALLNLFIKVMRSSGHRVDVED
jgi:hypothetical protein